MGIATGCIGMSLRDFERCTPSEFRAVFDAWYGRAQALERSGWEQKLKSLRTALKQASAEKRASIQLDIVAWQQKLEVINTELEALSVPADPSTIEELGKAIAFYEKRLKTAGTSERAEIQATVDGYRDKKAAIENELAALSVPQNPRTLDEHHTHTNFTTLERLGADDEGYLYVAMSQAAEEPDAWSTVREKIKAGYADDSERWADRLFDDWLDQAVRREDAVTFAELTVGGPDGPRLSRSPSDALKIDGNVVVTGGITMYGAGDMAGGSILDALPIDPSTLSKAGGMLSVITGTGGDIQTIAGIKVNGGLYTPDDQSIIELPSYPTSLAWGAITGKPAWIGSTKPSYSFSEITGKPELLAGYKFPDALCYHINSGTYVAARFINQEYAKLAHSGYIEYWQGVAGGGWFNLKAGKFIVAGGTSSQFLKGDGTLDAGTYLKSTDTANSASKLATARTLWGRPFDGMSDVYGSLDNVENITMSGALTVDGLEIYRRSDGALEIGGNVVVRGDITMRGAAAGTAVSACSSEEPTADLVRRIAALENEVAQLKAKI